VPKFDPNIILKLPLSKKLLILGIIWILIVVAFYYSLYSGKLSEKKELTVKLAKVQEEIIRKQKIANELPKFKAEKEELDKQLQQALAQLPNEKEIANLLDSISNAARSSNLDILTFKPGKEAPKGFYAEVMIDMKVEGGYNNLLIFFEKVAALPRIVNINFLNVTSAAKKEVKGDILLTTTFLVTTFKFLPQPPQPEAKK